MTLHSHRDFTEADFLLINASNLPHRPIFPYAFVQLSALMRQAGLRIERLDLLKIDRKDWETAVKEAVTACRPSMVGFHLRQCDSAEFDNYVDLKTEKSNGYFYPVDDTRRMIAAVRGISDAKVIVGGIGFSAACNHIFEGLGCDYGLKGDPDSFVKNFPDILRGVGLDKVDGLIRKKLDGSIVHNRQGYYPPNPQTEYNEEILNDLVEFYGHDVIFGDSPPTVAIEVMRGCPFSCSFCVEPRVKGKSVRERPIEVVLEEIEFLHKRGIRRFWFICSEINLRGFKYAKSLSEALIDLRERKNLAPFEWSAYGLPNMKEDEFQQLIRSGYVGGLNEILSFEDKNLHAAKVPYTVKQALEYLDMVHKHQNGTESSYTCSDERKKLIATNTPQELGQLLQLFLGNQQSTVETLRTTLATASDHRTSQKYTDAKIMLGTRIYDHMINEETTRPDDRVFHGLEGGQLVKNADVRDIAKPVYTMPGWIFDYFSDLPEIDNFMRFVEVTYLSDNALLSDEYGRSLVEIAGRLGDSDSGQTVPANGQAIRQHRMKLLSRLLDKFGQDDPFATWVHSAPGITPSDMDLENYAALKLAARFADISKDQLGSPAFEIFERLYFTNTGRQYQSALIGESEGTVHAGN